MVIVTSNNNLKENKKPITRMILRAVKPEDHVVVSNATGCWKFHLLSIHILHLKIRIFIQLLNLLHSTASGCGSCI